MSTSDPMHISSPHVRNSTLLHCVSSKTIQTKTNVAVTGGSPPLLLFTPKYLPHRRILGLGINQSAACLFETSTLLRKYYLSI